MRIDFVTLFPEMVSAAAGWSIMGRAQQKGLLEVRTVNPRDFSRDKHRRVDDRPFGGGPGMILMAEPLAAAVKSVRTKKSRVVFLSPQGPRFDQRAAERLSREAHVVLVCGRYEGIDHRASGLFDEELSVGDFVVTGGELPALIVADAVSRLVPGVLKKEEATKCESFSEEGLLESPQYTRPRVWRGKKVPAVLLSGDHERIAAWRRREATKATRAKRPDLIDAHSQTTSRR